MKIPARTAKQQGELAELAFIYRAALHGFTVSKPLGDNAPYDVIIAKRGRLLRVQVKSAARARKGIYEINAGRGRFVKRAYTRAHIDLLAAWIIPEDAWYLIPLRALRQRKTIRIRTRARGRFSRYREAWNALRW